MTRTLDTRSLLRMGAACGLILGGATGCPVDDLLAGSRADAAPSKDATTKDVAPDAKDAAPDASNSLYNSMSDPSAWSFFDISDVLPPGAGTSYSGAEFDGRYLYFVPYSATNVLRFDTSMSFADHAAWTYYSFVPNVVDVAGPGFGGGAAAFLYRGGAYDGSRFVYFAPFNPNTFAVQFDTHQTFSSSAAWSVFNTVNADPNANYWGVLCDVRYAYFVPNTTTNILAFDSNFASGGGFTAESDGGVSGAWISYDLAAGDAGPTQIANAEGFWGGVFDGQYVYFAPFSGAVVERHDTIQAVNFPSSYTGFNFVNAFVQPNPPKYWGGAYDGRNVYLVPYQNSPPLLVAYDTTSTSQFTDVDAWTSFDLRLLFAGDGGSADVGVAPGFVGAAYDGKRLFLAPAGNLTTLQGSAPVPVIAYDTTAPLTFVTSYSSYDPSVLNGNALAFEGAAYDGQYVYFVPHGYSVVARFEAKKTPGPLSPNSYTGSWW
jgi:hypothetical protein